MSITPPPMREPWLFDAAKRLISPSWVQWFQKLTSLDIVDTIYPIGSIYISTIDINPADIFRRGTWVTFGAGKTLVSLDASDSDFATVESTGGAKQQTPSAHTGTAVASHAAHTHTTPSLAHGAITGESGPASAGVESKGATASTLTLVDHTHDPGTYAVPDHAAGVTGNPSATLTHSVTQPNNHDPISVVQPYITVRMWKRVA